MNPQQLLPYVVPLIVVGVLFFRMRRMPARPVNISSLWIVPLIAVLAIGSGLWFMPHPVFKAIDYGIMAAAAILGIGTGVLRARTLTLRRCPDTGRVLMETSSFAFVLLVALIVVRLTFRNIAGSLGAVAVDASMLFALGMVVTQRLTIWRRVLAVA